MSASSGCETGCIVVSQNGQRDETECVPVNRRIQCLPPGFSFSRVQLNEDDEKKKDNHAHDPNHLEPTALQETRHILFESLSKNILVPNETPLSFPMACFVVPTNPESHR